MYQRERLRKQIECMKLLLNLHEAGISTHDGYLFWKQQLSPRKRQIIETKETTFCFWSSSRYTVGGK